ncbi:mannosyltransferase family protein [Paenibacillus filicis]|uniref:Mannosyltransferase family protein n=1 Tax=Paenibacillus gyeongsangnamensis TaxID=3388067 RepID=A0ABT4QC15_9BACL|nr:mannosyltransferase family protein [Paenibacillus filicis]MCZ8514225.1 mannosyltransferase family protein [Paenibacillus filicis]
MSSELRLNHKIMISIALLLILSRVLTLFTGYVGMNLFNDYNVMPVYENNPSDSFHSRQLKLPEPLAETKKPTISDLLKFDTYSYLRIATEGYDRVNIDEPHTAANWVFFPLYPLLISLAGKAVPFFEPLTIGLILSNLFLYVALLFFYLICRQRGLTEPQAGTAVFLLLLYPSSLYFSVVYTESLFLLLSSISVYYATNKRYALAFLAAGLSTVTRVPGVVNLLFVAGSFCLDEGFRFTRRYVKLVLLGGLSIVPMGLYLLHMKSVSGDYLAPFHEQSLHWFRYKTWPFKNYYEYLKYPYFSTPDGWDNGWIAFVVSTAVFAIYLLYFIVHFKVLIRDMRQLLFYVYGAMLIVIPFSSQPYYMVSVVRYMMVCIPLYLYLVSLTAQRENGLRFFQMLFMILNVIITVGYFNGYYFVI